MAALICNSGCVTSSLVLFEPQYLNLFCCTFIVCGSTKSQTHLLRFIKVNSRCSSQNYGHFATCGVTTGDEPPAEGEASAALPDHGDGLQAPSEVQTVADGAGGVPRLRVLP